MSIDGAMCLSAVAAAGKVRLVSWEKLVILRQDEVEQNTRSTRRSEGVVDRGAQAKESRNDNEQRCARRWMGKSQW